MQRWKKNLYALWITQIISLTSFGLGLPFLPFYIQELGVVEPEQIKFFTGILSTAPAVTMAIMAPVWGKLADKYGRKLMILRAMFFAILVIAGMGFVTNVWQLVILRGCQGLFTGTITAATAFVAATTPKERLSYALGVISSSTFIGYTIGPVLGGYFADNFGFRFSFFSGSIVMLIGFLLVLFFVVEEKEVVVKGSEKQDSNNEKSNYKLFTPLVVSLIVVLFFHRVTRTIFSPYLPLYIQGVLNTTEGASKLTGYINGIIGIASAVSGLTISRLGDKYDKLKIVTILLGIAFVVSLSLTKAGSLYMFALLYGLLFFFIGGVEPIITSITAENTRPERRGELFGYQGLVGSIGWICSPMVGAYISMNYEVSSILYLIPALLTINYLLLISIRKRLNKKGNSLISK